MGTWFDLVWLVDLIQAVNHHGYHVVNCHDNTTYHKEHTPLIIMW